MHKTRHRISITPLISYILYIKKHNNVQIHLPKTDPKCNTERPDLMTPMSPSVHIFLFCSVKLTPYITNTNKLINFFWFWRIHICSIVWLRTPPGSRLRCYSSAHSCPYLCLGPAGPRMWCWGGAHHQRTYNPPPAPPPVAL